VSEVKTAVDAITGGIQTVLPAPATIVAAPAKPDAEEFELEMLRMQVTPAAVALLFTGVLAFISLTATGIGGLVLLTWNIYVRLGVRPSEWVFLFFSLSLAIMLVAYLAYIAARPIIVGARRMRQFEKYESAVGAAIWTILLGSYPLLVGLPVGLWALWVLRNPKIKAAFARQALLHRQLQRSGSPAPRTPRPTGPVRRKLRSLMQSFFSLVVGSRAEGDSSPVAGPDHPKGTKTRTPTEPGPRNP
jgi:hypothetical protein